VRSPEFGFAGVLFAEVMHVSLKLARRMAQRIRVRAVPSSGLTAPFTRKRQRWIHARFRQQAAGDHDHSWLRRVASSRAFLTLSRSLAYERP
jgi:hypothetical protein